MSFLIFDPSVSGAAGDMLIAGLLDLIPQEKRDDFCKKFNSILVKYDSKFALEWKKVNIHGFSGIQIIMIMSESKLFSTTMDVTQTENEIHSFCR